ncbi:SHC-transforming protein 1-like [Eriocheir sinensis]|uniref:SHC-transforming protein 1-like n=1 Tax=Eriocheir sinensis TaxID=95602 RepID=UPI0021C5B921|nr:SHC-transforming protein 1-like [Eriocheir sinensis]XP_050701949.1 SHC-transforming protein 1-like [Eriocheir sinensis]XP_050701958.1 SHC-transforming protein 1-like [Eriocheir sinensis]XP_050701970.1 SHC-transforming protein 1-like [Eriocheir sinensis]
MFSLRPYRSLRDDEETVPGKGVLCGGVDSPSASRLHCVSQGGPETPGAPTPSTLSLALSSPTATSTTTTTTSSSGGGSTTFTTSSSSAVVSGSGGGGKASPLSLTSLKAAWRNLTSLGVGGSRLPHLERPDVGSSEPHDYRYTHFPNKRYHKDTSFDETHIHLTPAARTYTHPHRSPVPPPPHTHTPPPRPQVPEATLTLAKCLRKHREKQQARALTRKSKSDNALQKVGVHVKSHSDQNLHKVWLASGGGRTNSIFSTVQLSGGSGDSCGSSGGSRRGGRHNRSKSLERQQGARVYPAPPAFHPRHTRSLERNHKFRVDLRPPGPHRDEPPEHQAPPPPSLTPTHVPWAPDAVEGVSVQGQQQHVQQGWAGGMEGGHAAGGGGSFINKPARGWLHPDQQLADGGVRYGVRYIGCLEVNTSMKSLNFDTRSLIAKECISKVCEAAGLKTADRKRKVVKTISRILGERPLMEHAGSNVNLTITSTALNLTNLESGQIVACHDMPNISFASGGDPDTLDFIAYVAKDSRYGRACFVLECGGGLAQDVITTIGQAFELRFKEYLKRTPSVQYTSVKSEKPGINGDGGISWGRDDPEYYNDLPGKVPPDLPPPPVPPLPQYSASESKRPVLASPASTPAPSVASSSPVPAQTQPLANSHQTLSSKVSDNLIDLSCEGTAPGPLRSEPEYVNDAVIRQKQLLDQRDPFDMQPFTMQLSQLSGGVGSPGGGGAAAAGAIGTVAGGAVGGTNKPLPLNQRLQLQREAWFHGAISRKEAEMLLLQDGDFLVRESQGTAGQYVLTGMQNNTKKHLLLVDPEGVVRTKSRTFDSVSHLIIYHRDNELPIVSAESALLLRNPVLRNPR